MKTTSLIIILILSTVTFSGCSVKLVPNDRVVYSYTRTVSHNNVHNNNKTSYTNVERHQQPVVRKVRHREFTHNNFHQNTKVVNTYIKPSSNNKRMTFAKNEQQRARKTDKHVKRSSKQEEVRHTEYEREDDDRKKKSEKKKKNRSSQSQRD